MGHGTAPSSATETTASTSTSTSWIRCREAAPTTDSRRCCWSAVWPRTMASGACWWTSISTRWTTLDRRSGSPTAKRGGTGRTASWSISTSLSHSGWPAIAQQRTQAMGVSVTSLEPGLVQIANHFDQGSGFDGIHLEGPAHAVLSHVAVSRAGRRPIFGNGAAHLSSGALWASSRPTDIDVAFSFVEGGFVGEGNQDGPIDFVRVPFETFFTTGPGNPDRVPFPAGTDIEVGDTLELEDDGIARDVVSVSGGQARFGPSCGRRSASRNLLSHSSRTRTWKRISHCCRHPLGSTPVILWNSTRTRAPPTSGSTAASSIRSRPSEAASASPSAPNI